MQSPAHASLLTELRAGVVGRLAAWATAWLASQKRCVRGGVAVFGSGQVCRRFQWAGGLLSLAWTCVSQASDPGVYGPPPPTNQVAVPAALSNLLADPSPPAEGNEAFRSAPPAFASTNLLKPEAQASADRLREQEVTDRQRQLELARRQRLMKRYADATAGFAALLEEGVPEAIQRTALIELATTAQEENDLTRAQQIYAQYLLRWPEDGAVPEILLRQGLIFRRMGIYPSALTKFYSVMTTALTVHNEQLDYYRRVVLQAQTEIGETYEMIGKFREASETYKRLLKLDAPSLNKQQIHYKLVRALAGLGQHEEALGQALDYLTRYPETVEQAEVRFLLANSLKKVGRKNEALEQVLALLKSQQPLAYSHPETLAYWQQRTGNEIANQLYREGDFLSALDIYLSLLPLNPAPAWQWPVQYQIGLVYERLEQPAKAAETYSAIVQRASELGTNATPSQRSILEMARWRKDFLHWVVKTETTQHQLRRIAPGSDTVPTNLLNLSTSTPTPLPP